MAIRFVDVGSGKGEEAEPPPVRRGSREAGPEIEPEAEPEASPGGEAPLPGLTHAKPEPKQRGRKKPMAAAGPDRAEAAGAPSAPLLDGLLPELQAHAKPTPKPRGRKKAFG
ncbi:hypothetical protein D3273_09295 [Lichenibacterium minor]|uniref:Uncharacterized protein n=1 Tax=Lichenibacterium minor TaxID=2316528 RepID=A0A4Q2U742_9HYPH|nr:hypothetical protein [Lichenibacterium minor]RYC32220.1 hypothetical protein D3273_09295 [Lichenibacterium minor]